MFIFDNKMEQQPPLTKLRKTIGSTLMNNMQVYFFCTDRQSYLGCNGLLTSSTIIPTFSILVI